MASGSIRTVSVIIPCHNEEAGLEHLRARLLDSLPGLEKAGPYRFEVLLFDNGSTDGTLRRMEELFGRDGRFKIHHSPANVGIGGSLRAGLALTVGEIVVGMDSDCTYEPDAIADLIAPLSGGWDVSTGSPYHPEGHVLHVPGWRLLLSRGLSVVYRTVTPLTLWTYTSMFRGYRREVLESITWRSDGFLSTSEILIEAAAAGFTICEVPTTLAVRRFGASKIRLLSVIRDHLLYIFRLTVQRELRRRLRENYRKSPSVQGTRAGELMTERAVR